MKCESLIPLKSRENIDQVSNEGSFRFGGKYSQAHQMMSSSNKMALSADSQVSVKVVSLFHQGNLFSFFII